VREDLVVDAPAGAAQGGDGEAVVLGGPNDDRVGGEGQAPHLLGLLLVVPAPDGTLAGVGESAAEGVQVLALVELPGDAPPVRLVGQIPGGVDGTAQCPVLLDRAGQRVLLPP